MAEYSISSANLHNIESNLTGIYKSVDGLSHRMDVVSSQVNTVDQRVSNIYSELSNLVEEFQHYVAEAERVSTLADAKQQIVMLEQELDKKYGHYETIRRHTIGILQATDINLVRKETIAASTEQMMLDAPRYWLAPSLIALSAWFNDNKELADRAIKEAIHRDDEKTSLMFCLVSRRVQRLSASLLWLDRYFAMQNPKKMDRKVIIVLDAFASGIFGPNSKGLCIDKIEGWISELSSGVGFIEQQREQWSNAIIGKKVNINQNEFKYLPANTENWNQIENVLSWAMTHEVIYNYFNNIFNKNIENYNSIIEQIDEILENLVSNYDIEELPIRKELRNYRLIIEEKGIKKNADSRMKAEELAYEQDVDFSQHLTSIALAPESSGALLSTQKFAIALSKEWITEAYKDLTAQHRLNIPVDIKININQWSGLTREGSNEEELLESISKSVDDDLYDMLKKLEVKNSDFVGAIIIAIIVGIIGISTIIIPILAVVLVVIYINNKKKDMEKQKAITIDKMNELKKNMQNQLKATLAEVVDFRRLYKQKDKEYNKVIDFMNSISAEQYINLKNSSNTREILAR